MRVIHFEINGDNPEALSKFYEDVFEWKIDKWDGPTEYWMVRTGKDTELGINGGIMKKNDFNGTINTIGVDSVDQSIEKIKKAGGKVVKEKMEIPGVGWMAYCADSEGNVFGIMQSK